MNIRKAEHSHAVHVTFILEVRGRSRTETYDVGGSRDPSTVMQA